MSPKPVSSLTMTRSSVWAELKGKYNLIPGKFNPDTQAGKRQPNCCRFRPSIDFYILPRDYLLYPGMRTRSIDPASLYIIPSSYRKVLNNVLSKLKELTVMLCFIHKLSLRMLVAYIKTFLEKYTRIIVFCSRSAGIHGTFTFIRTVF